MVHRVLIIGYGAIGQKILTELASNENFKLAVFLRSDSETLYNPSSVEVLRNVEDIKIFAPHLIVEAAGQAVVRDAVGDWLRKGIDVLISSVGALNDPVLLNNLEEAAQVGGATLIIPSGALAGIDYVQAVGDVAGTSIRYESRKPLAAWHDELERRGLSEQASREAVALYHGDAAEAAARYPSNLNVAATLALAAGGFDRVDVTVIADPQAQGNTHTISVDGPVGTMRMSVVNRPAPDNPKTSMLVAHSISRTIIRHFSPIRIM